MGGVRRTGALSENVAVAVVETPWMFGNVSTKLEVEGPHSALFDRFCILIIIYSGLLPTTAPGLKAVSSQCCHIIWQSACASTTKSAK